MPFPWYFLNEDIKQHFYDRAAREIPLVIEKSIIDILKKESRIKNCIVAHLRLEKKMNAFLFTIH